MRDDTAVRVDQFRHDLEEGGLADAICADQGNPVALKLDLFPGEGADEGNGQQQTANRPRSAPAAKPATAAARNSNDTGSVSEL